MQTRALSLATLALAASLVAPPGARAGDCGAAGPDLRPAQIPSLVNYAVAGGVDALSFGIVACNVGAQPIAVQASTSQHYVVTSNLYRLEDRGGWLAFEQVGMGWVFHSFCALAQSACCTCTPTGGCDQLSPGCSSADSASVTGQPFRLGPRADVDASTATFAFPSSDPDSAFDQYRRCAVATDDLHPSAGGARYFGELLGLAPEDAAAGRSADNASWRELSLALSSGNGTFAPVGVDSAGVPALQAWKLADPAVELREIALAGDGHLLLAWRVSDLGGGTWHYEYALYNLDSSEAVGAFTLPLSAGVSVTSQGFHDVVYRGGDGLGGVDRDSSDWAQSAGAGVIDWRTTPAAQDPNANALRWGTLYNFRFDADAPPTSGTLWLTRFESGALESVLGVAVPSALAAGVGFCDASDGALSACPCANPGLADTGCDNAQSTGGVRLAAVLFAPDGVGGGSASLLASGFPSGATPGAVLIRAAARAPAPAPFGDGLLCLEVASVVRVASGNAAAGSLLLPFVHGAGAGTFAYQLWYRNLPASFCTAAGFNLSAGRELVW